MPSLNLVHDYLYVYGGAERMLEHVHAIWPEAPLYTLMYVRDRLPETFRRMDVRTTWVDRLPARLRLQRVYAMLQPLAFAAIRPRGDVLSFASFGAKAVRPVGGRHVCYCFTPPRFLWGPFRGTPAESMPAPLRPAQRAIEAALRRWDRAAAQRVDHFITMSPYVAARLQRVYDRTSLIVPPPVDVARFTRLTPRPGDYFLVVARFEAYKRIDLAIEACRRLGVPLRVIGSGVDDGRLRRLAAEAPGVTFLGAVDDAEVERQLAGCRAFLFPGEEDFGLTAVEAQAAGKPVIAFAQGGAEQTVKPGETGEFFDALTVDSLAAAVEHFEAHRYHPDTCRANAARFAPAAFREQFQRVVQHLMAGNTSAAETAAGRPVTHDPAVRDVSGAR